MSEKTKTKSVSKRSTLWLVVAIALVIVRGVVEAKHSLQGVQPQQVAAAVKANAAALKAFTWQQRMQIQVKGETKKVTLTQMNYDMSGNLQKTQLSEQPAPDSSQQQQSSGGGRLRGRVKEKVVAKKTGEFKEMMQGIGALVKSYTELPHDQLQAALKNAAFSEGQGDMAGTIQIQMNGVLQAGDSLTLWLDRNALLFRRVAIATSYEQKPLTATANYAMLQSHEVYMGQAIVNYPDKQVVLEIDNLNYQRSQ
jgi:hypothetical protein